MNEFTDTRDRNPNRLAKEKSPYLLQHAYNPVNWFPWGEEAFDKAKREHKPIFLSIGYSTCHWCHVMEGESFEDEEVAELLNKHFVAIKVDREERPDIDNIYMTVCQALTGQGGWPLTIVMTPEKQAFFAATYIPKRAKYGRKGLMDLLPLIREKWEEDAEELMETGREISRQVERRMLSGLQGEVSEATLDKAYQMYDRDFDPAYGGFGGAPKFPASHNLSFLLRYYHRTGNMKALGMVEKTLNAMSRGGIYDHIGYGFSRYSVDERWLVPHFEKMLYDNALLAWTYLEAYQITKKAAYRDTAEQIFAYVLRDMTDPEGGFYSAEDADSEGQEGKFYVWEPEEIIEVLGPEDGELFCRVYDITEEGNFEGHNIPNRIATDLSAFAEVTELDESGLRDILEASRQKLFEYREARIHPGKDDKILTSWNGLMIMALAKGYSVTGKREYLDAAEKAARFILKELRRADGRLLARFRDGEAAYPAYADDYACLIWGLLELYEACFEPGYLEQALELNGQLIELFWDKENGGFYFYGSDSETLLMRNKEIYDGAMPSGNSIALMNLVKLSRLTDDERLAELADKQIRAFAGAVGQYPPGYAMFLIGLELFFAPSREIVIAGDLEAKATREMIEAVHTSFTPESILVVLNNEPGDREIIHKLIPASQDKGTLDGKPTAYVCQNFSCQAPTHNIETLNALIQGK
ncbi:thioredoxin domain-containing protein [Paenibacillus sp. M1]|uniref:Thioredoxin domain-containing protein n=1 Tax=Paenibacillus haidiansis TaxID=1574488 RepID=A0ABU7VU83_9BACL